MKKLLKTTFVFIMTAAIFALSCASAFAAGEDSLKINGEASAQKGDTVTYKMYMGDCTDKLEGIQMSISYDSSCLKVDKDSLEFPSLSDVVSNAGVDNIILFNWTNVTNLASFEDTKELVSVDFQVLKGGNTDITYFITEMYGDDMTYFKTYTLTYSLDVNGKSAVTEGTPRVCEDEKVKNENQGGFVNYADGKGEENGSGEGHVAVTGVTSAQEITKPVNGASGGNNAGAIVTVVAIIVVIIAIIIAVILSNHYSKGSGKNNKSKKSKE